MLSLLEGIDDSEYIKNFLESVDKGFMKQKLVEFYKLYVTTYLKADVDINLSQLIDLQRNIVEFPEEIAQSFNVY